MKHLTKARALTEIEIMKKDFPEYDKTPKYVESTTNGDIIFIETDDKKLQKFLKEKGFIERL